MLHYCKMLINIIGVVKICFGRFTGEGPEQLYKVRLIIESGFVRAFRQAFKCMAGPVLYKIVQPDNITEGFGRDAHKLFK